MINQKSNRRKYLSQVDTLWATLEEEGLALHRDEPPSQKVNFVQIFTLHSLIQVENRCKLAGHAKLFASSAKFLKHDV